jgi:hypothetical protein
MNLMCEPTPFVKSLMLRIFKTNYPSLFIVSFPGLIVLDQLIAPYVEEKLGIRVELHAIFAVGSVRVEFVETWRRIGRFVHEPNSLRHRLTADHLLVNFHRALELFFCLKVVQRHFFVLNIELGTLELERIDTLIEHLGALVYFDRVFGEIVKDAACVLTQRA